VIVLDASAIIAFLGNEPAVDEVERLLREEGCATTSVGIAEVVDEFQRIRGQARAAVVDTVEFLLAGGLQVLAVTHEDGLTAGSLRAEHYHRRVRAVSMAGCVTLAVALNRGYAIATSDHAMAVLGRDVGLEVVALPNSAGQLW
jgi:PIN domain nuclease of toxin-antitoxin system